MLLAELQERCEVDRGAVLLRELLAERRGVLRVGDHFEFPRFAGQADFFLLLVGKPVRDRLAARNIAELVRWREVCLELLERRREFWRRWVCGISPKACAGN